MLGKYRMASGYHPGRHVVIQTACMVWGVRFQSPTCASDSMAQLGPKVMHEHITPAGHAVLSKVVSHCAHSEARQAHMLHLLWVLSTGMQKWGRLAARRTGCVMLLRVVTLVGLVVTPCRLARAMCGSPVFAVDLLPCLHGTCTWLAHCVLTGFRPCLVCVCGLCKTAEVFVFSLGLHLIRVCPMCWHGVCCWSVDGFDASTPDPAWHFGNCM